MLTAIACRTICSLIVSLLDASSLDDDVDDESSNASDDDEGEDDDDDDDDDNDNDDEVHIALQQKVPMMC